MDCPTPGVNAIVQNAMFVGEYSVSNMSMLYSRLVRLRCQSPCSGCVRPPIGGESGGFRRSLGYSLQGFCPCTATARGGDYRHDGNVIGTRRLSMSSHTFLPAAFRKQSTFTSTLTDIDREVLACYVTAYLRVNTG